MQIRTAIEADIQAILNIWNPIIQDSVITFTSAQKTHDGLRQMFIDKARAGHPFIVATRGNALLGFATYGLFRAGPGYAHTMEHSIMLGQTARGQGVGRALLVKLEDHARSQKIHSLIAGISCENPDAAAFHHRCGFTKIAILPEVGYKFSRWLDLILMQKNL